MFVVMMAIPFNSISPVSAHKTMKDAISACEGIAVGLRERYGLEFPFDGVDGWVNSFDPFKLILVIIDLDDGSYRLDSLIDLWDDRSKELRKGK